MNFKLFPKHIYTYNDNGVEKICVYVCDTDNANEIVVGLIDEYDSLNNNYIKIENLNKVLYLDRYRVLRSSRIKSPLYLKGKEFPEINSNIFNELSKRICKLLLVQYEELTNKYLNENFNNDTNELENIMMPEKMIKLLTWNIKKLELKFKMSVKNLSIMKYNVYFAYLGTNIGAEIEKLRPVVVWKMHENSQNANANIYYVFPISSKVPKKDYYYNIKYSIENEQNIIKINCGQLISIKRFVKPYTNDNGKTYRLDLKTINEIREALKIYFGIQG